MNPDEEQYRSDLYRPKSGQTKCRNCSKVYNNRFVPKYCSCFYLLGGKYEKKEKILDAMMVTDNLASIR